MFKTQVDKTVYLLRHGQSIDNASPVFQSESSPLSEKGIKQAEEMANRISKISFDTLIASPLLRTKQTAEIISKSTGKNVEYSELFVERIKPRKLYGKPYTDINANNLWRNWEKSLFTEGMRIEDGENFDDLMLRADKALNYLKDRSEKSMVVVTHGYFLRTLVIRVLLGDLLTGDLFRSSINKMLTENTGLTVLQYRDSFEEEANWKLWVYNDHAHLAG